MRDKGGFAARVAAAMNQSNQHVSVLPKKKVDPQLDKSCGSPRSGNEDGSKARFSLPILLRDTLDQLYSGDAGLRTFTPAKTAS